MIDFLIIFKLVSAYARARGLADGRMETVLDACDQLGHGQSVPASKLLRAQALAMRWWANIAILPLLSGFAVGLLLGLIKPGHLGDVVGAAFVGIFAAAALAALGQVPVQTYRSLATMRSVRRMGGRATRCPLQPGSRGLPRRRDFWLAGLIPVTVFVIVLVLRVQYPNGP